VTTSVAQTVARWAVALCRAGSNHPEALAGALGLNPAVVTPQFNEVLLPPPPGLRRLRFIVGADDGLVRFAEVQPDVPLSLTNLTALFGAPEPVPAAFHRPATMVAFPDVRVAGGRQRCGVLADLDPEMLDKVAVVTLHPQRTGG
jgi:hypothetical protein